MKTFKEYVEVYRKEMEKGDIREAYQKLMEYMMSLRLHFKSKFPEYSVPGTIYYGYMDMTYFPLTTEVLKARGLKVAIVLIHDKIRFEVWLAGSNRQIRSKYIRLMKESGWNKYDLSKDVKGYDSIVEFVLAENPDFDDLVALTSLIEAGTVKFINDITKYFESWK